LFYNQEDSTTGTGCHGTLDDQLALILTGIAGQNAVELQGATVFVQSQSRVLAQHGFQLRFAGGAAHPAQLDLTDGFAILPPAQDDTVLLKIPIRQLVLAGQLQRTLFLDGYRGLKALRDAHILER